MLANRSLSLITGALLVLSLAFAGTANAKAFTMAGSWYQNRGPLVDIPINGGPVLCIGGALQTGCVGFFKPAGGGIPGGGAVSAVGVAPAAFTIPDNAFAQALGAQTVAVGIVPTVVQLVTTFVFDGPANVGQALGASPTFAAGAPAAFGKDAWSNDAGQTARLAATFAWCPGIGGPACAAGTLATGSAGIQGRIGYTPGANAFGGTMGMMLSGGGATSIIAGSAAGVPFLAHLPIMGAGTNPQAGGVGYAFQNVVILGSAPLYFGFMTSTGNGSGLLTSTGPPLTTGNATMSPVVIAGDTNVNFGMPWTTGTVSVKNTETLGGMGQTGSITAMGSDSRTAAGKGRITMVAGGTSHRTLSTLDFEALEVIVLDFNDGSPTPSMGPAGLATVAMLMALSAGYAIRNKFNA
ncbi:MAG: hypothetical protein ACI8W3_000842 [Myxococcota bacterium]|jgi:hypothetical protein